MMQRIIGESIQGYTHIQRNLECQDRKLSRELEDGSVRGGRSRKPFLPL